jgi:hypothetical protein
MTVGLALGGMAAAFVADRVGYLSQRGELSSMLRTLRAVGVHPGGSLVSQIDFRIRALGVLTVWPLVSLALVGVVIAIRAARR